MAGREQQLVLVTGATSFIGCHVINLLLQEGWPVRGTVRSLASDKTKALRECFPQHAKQLELVEADLMREQGWDVACNGCTYMMHLACPVEMSNFHKDPMNRQLKEPGEIQATIDMIVGGTRWLFKAAMAAGVKRIVLTSSVSAMLPAGFAPTVYPHRDVPGVYDPEAYLKVLNEDVWSDTSLVDGYPRAKTEQERAAWKEVEGSKTELVSINPTIVLGPPLTSRIVSDSNAMVDIAMCQPPNLQRSLPACPSMSFGVCDVRDVAKAHVQAILVPGAAGNRYLVCNRVMDILEILSICREVFKPMGYSPLQFHLPKCVAGLLSPCDPLMRRMYRNWAKYPKVDSSKMRRDLVPDPIDPKKTVMDTVLASVATGRYERKPGYKTGEPEYQNVADPIFLKASLA